MKGLELARRYYEECAKPLLEQQFPDVLNRIAVGLVGEGSECLGFDDAISQDHDFEPGFCLFITAEDEREFGFRLERLYAKLPKTFNGFTRSPLSPVGGNRHGVQVIDEFYTKFLGTPRIPDTPDWWFHIPPALLRTASNGEVWRDDSGVFSAVRNTLLNGYPNDVRLKKIAAHALLMAQAGSHNTARCIARGEWGAAQRCLMEYLRHAISLVYLLNNVYEPFYKWAYQGLRELPLLSELERPLSELLTHPDPLVAIAELDACFANEFRSQGLSDLKDDCLSSQAYAITDTIRDGNIRNMHIMDGI